MSGKIETQEAAGENIVTETPVPEAQEPEKKEPKKRTTITSLKGDFKTLESFMDEEIIPAIELIEDRLNSVIEKLKQTPIMETPMLEQRLQRLEESTTMHNDTLLSDVKARLEMQDDLNVIINNTSTMQDAIIALQETETAEPSEPRTMAELIQPETTRTERIADLAKACISMSDALLICRYLKADPNIPEEERIEILHIACQRAGVPVSAGMKARAGVKYMET